MLSEEYYRDNRSFFERYQRSIVIGGGLLIAVALGCFFVYRFFADQSFWQSQIAPESLVVPERVFAQPLILSLDSPIKDKNGIPYSGTVQYDPNTQTYSYIATNESGLVTPVGASAFSSDTQYLALRANGDSNDFVLYDLTTFAPIRVIRNLPIGAVVPAAVWSPDGETFAYLLMGIPIPALIIGHIDSTIGESSPGSDFPFGFSPDGSKILTRGRSVPVIINTTEGSHTEVSGIDSMSPETKFVVSPSRKYLVTNSQSAIQWYEIHWDTAKLTLLGSIPDASGMPDVVFMSDDTLLVQKQRDDLMRAYSYDQERGVTAYASYRLSLPEGAHILHVLPSQSQ